MPTAGETKSHIIKITYSTPSKPVTPREKKKAAFNNLILDLLQNDDEGGEEEDYDDEDFPSQVVPKEHERIKPNSNFISRFVTSVENTNQRMIKKEEEVANSMYLT